MLSGVEILAFTAEQACRLTGLSPRQLSYWDRTGFFSPGYEHTGRGAYARLYTFRDIVGLRAIAILRKTAPLQELRKVGGWLAQHYNEPWSTLTFYVIGKKVAFLEPSVGTVQDAGGRGQTYLPIALEPIARDMDKKTERLRQRRSDVIGRIERHRYVAQNAHVIAGTRVPTLTIWRFHQAGYNRKAILAEYPQLKRRDVVAAIDFERSRQAKAG